MRKIHFLFILTVCVFVGGVTGEDDQKTLGDECDYDEDCESISNSICNSAFECECAINYTPSSNKSVCLPLATKTGDKCEIREQCANITHAECVANICTVTAVTDANVPTTTTETNAKNECTKDSECSSFLVKRVCKNGTCVMDIPPASPRAIGLDISVLLRPCKNDSECSIEGSACINNLCACKEGLVNSLNLKSCLEVAKSVGDKCVDNAQCLPLSTVCDNGKCMNLREKTNFGFETKFPQLLIGSSCSINEECKHIAHAECRENVCQCNGDFVISFTSNSCLEKAKKEGDPCNIDKQCEDIKGTNCILKKCVKPGVIGTKLAESISNEKAKKEGDPCKTDKQCEDIKGATCVQEKCVKPGVVGTKLGKQNNGSSTQTVSKLILAAILLIKTFSV